MVTAMNMIKNSLKFLYFLMPATIVQMKSHVQTTRIPTIALHAQIVQIDILFSSQLNFKIISASVDTMAMSPVV